LPQTKEICSMKWAAKTKALTLSLAVLLGSLTVAEAEMSRTHVDFAGWTGTAIDGEIVGREFDRYELNAVAGDTLTVLLHSPNTATYFNVYAPGRGPGDEALANSEMVGGPVRDINEFSGVLPETGVYEVVVYMVRAAARRDEVAPYAIEIDLLQPTDANDPDAAERFFQVRTRSAGGHLNVHTGPAIDAPRLGRFNNGAVLRDIGGCAEHGGREWCEVMAYEGGLAGWAAREFLAPVSPRRAAAPVTPPRHVATSTAPRPTLSADFSTTSEFFHVHLGDPRGHLNVHAEPSAGSIRVGRLPDGADLRNVGGCVEAGGRTWCDVMQAGGGVSGWVAAEYLRNGNPAAQVTTHTGAPLPVTEDFADGMAGGPDFWQRRSRQFGQRAARAHPSVDAAPVFARFHDGATLRNADGCRMSEGRRWCYISSVAGDVTGWVAGDFLREGSAPGVATHLPMPVARCRCRRPNGAQPQVLGPAYDTTGGLTCVDGIDGPNATCSFGAVHEGSGNGYVQITEPGFGGRTITFENGGPVYFDQSEADGDVTMDVARLGDIWSIQIGPRRFEVPVALFEAHPDVVTRDGPAAGPAAGAGPGRRACGRHRVQRHGGDRLHPRRDAATTTCQAGVVREGNGSGFVTVFWPDGGSRVIFFEGNTPVRYDESEADGGAAFSVTQDANGTFTVFVGDARFVIPEALIVGG
jgi:uncharacterized protein YraI